MRLTVLRKEVCHGYTTNKGYSKAKADTETDDAAESWERPKTNKSAGTAISGLWEVPRRGG